MPNHCHSTLTFVLPHDQADDFINAIEGPDDWNVPALLFQDIDEVVAQARTGRTVHGSGHAISAHDALWMESLIAQRSADAWKEERARRLDLWPIGPWMPISKACALLMATDPAWPKANTTVPLSLPRLLPFDADSFAEAFPGTTDAKGFWTPEGNKDEHGGIIALRTQMMGSKWGAYDFRFDADEDVVAFGTKGLALLTIHYSTAWTPVTSLGHALHAPLLAHKAKLLLRYDDGGGSYGYELIDPATDRHENGDIDIEQPEDLEDDDEGQDAWCEGLSDLLLQKAIEKADDPEFSQALGA